MVKNNSVLRRQLILLFTFSLHLTFGQNSITGDSYLGLSSFESFQERKYRSVINSLEIKEKISADEEILLLLSELKTGKGEVGQVEEWLSNNPKHPIKPLVSYHLGEYFFYAKATNQSRKYLESVSVTDLSERNQAGYGYISGLLALDQKQYKNAGDLFQHARKKGFDEVEKLDYYEGYAAYHLGMNDKALSGFRKTENSEEFGTSSKYFIAKMLLEDGNEDEVINLAQNELSDEKTITNSGFHQLIGEAYAQKGSTEKADAFFERAVNLHPARPSAALYYQAGVSKFKIGNEELAIQYLTEAGIQGGEYAQLSAFQLARLYVDKQQFEKALSAYIEASGSGTDEIRDESFFQAANLNAKLNNYADAISYAIDYLNKFDNPERRILMQDLIAQSYLRTSNYDLAIDHLSSIGELNQTQKNVYQKVTYQKAVLAYNDGNFSDAEKWFTESLKYVSDTKLQNNAYYHLGEIDLKANRFDEAIIHYTSQTSINLLSHYGLGYCRYNKQLYEDAISHFRISAGSDKPEISTDSRVRLADCLYATKSYEAANSIYKEVSEQLNAPYLTFQSGMCLRRLDRKSEATAAFQKLFNEDRYAAKSWFQTGMIRFESAQFREAEESFSVVIDKYPNSQEYETSLLNRAVSRKNLGKLDEAKSDYEVIITEYIDSEIALNAILGLQELEQAGTEVKDLRNYIERYRKAHPESSSLELIEFEAAKRLYFDFAYEKAAEAFANFLSNYQESGNTIEAKYYLADSYYRMDAFEQAKPVFDELKSVQNSYSNRVLTRLGEINKSLDFLNQSEEAYKSLAEMDFSPKDTYNARKGLMKLYFEQGRYSDAIEKADQILSSNWKPLNAEEEAVMVKARCYFSLEKLPESVRNFQSLSQNRDAYGAESNYFLALINYRNADYNESLNSLFDLNANYGSYTEWVDKSYLLIAKNYIEMDELFQAKATLRSILQHSKNEEVKSESGKLLLQIEETVFDSDSTKKND